jgi:hypothetical protein
MPTWRIVVASLAALCTVPPAVAQTWKADDGRIRISVKYRANNEVRVESVGVQRRDPDYQFRLTMLATAKATTGKGFSRFALTKVTSCGLINGYGITPCRFVARMLNAGENVPSKPGETITHYDVKDLLGDSPPPGS